MQIILETPIVDSPRVQQVRGMFDLPADKISRLHWDVRLPLDEKLWHIGLIVGPSGCGKTTIARRIFPEMERTPELNREQGSVLDAFPETMPIKEIVALLSAVGFASPPAWLRPFRVLSTGQQFRVSLALLLAWTPATERIVFDEFTSRGRSHRRPDRQRGAGEAGALAAIASSSRSPAMRTWPTGCNPTGSIARPRTYSPGGGFGDALKLGSTSFAVAASAWPLFAPHHYLSAALANSAVCFAASWRDRPVAFSAWLPFVGPGPKTRREHRTVTLPDYQGVGIGNALSDFAASLWAGLGYRAISTTTHPAMIRARLRSPNWQMHRRPSFAAGHEGRLRHATTRLTAGFRYVGPAWRMTRRGRSWKRRPCAAREAGSASTIRCAHGGA